LAAATLKRGLLSKPPREVKQCRLPGGQALWELLEKNRMSIFSATIPAKEG